MRSVAQIGAQGVVHDGVAAEPPARQSLVGEGKGKLGLAVGERLGSNGPRSGGGCSRGLGARQVG